MVILPSSHPMASASGIERPVDFPDRGFTVIELLAVMAVIAILVGILLPAASIVRKSARKAKTKAQFNQYAIAYMQFKAEYGYYPSMGSPDEQFDFRGRNPVFIQTLSGRTREGFPPTEAYAKMANRRNIPFFEFSRVEFAGTDLEICGETIDRNEIVDAFDNPNITIIADRDGDGTVKDLEGNIINSAVLVFSRKMGCPDWEEVKSWE